MTTDEFSQQSLCAIMTLTQPNFSTRVIIETRFQALLPTTRSFDIVRYKLLACGSVTTGYGGYILFPVENVSYRHCFSLIKLQVCLFWRISTFFGGTLRQFSKALQDVLGFIIQSKA